VVKIIRRLIWLDKGTKGFGPIVDDHERDTTITTGKKILGRIGFFKQVINYKED
jgi:hypothetical protein